MYDQNSANHITDSGTEDPFISPEFHRRNRSLSSTSHISVTSSTADCCSNASTLRRQRPVWHWRPRGSRLTISRIKAVPIRWLFVVLCLIVTFIVWHLPPPPTRDFAFHLDEQVSTSAFQILRPRASAESHSTDPEKWLRDNSEEALSRNKRWWTRSSPKPRAAIITLVRNEELEGIMQSMRQLEHHWNRKYQYPWIFFNEKPFSEEFKVIHPSGAFDVC